MKSIILGGAPRSGKTTLARRLQKQTGFSHISGDALVSTFGGIFPQLGIDHENGTEATAAGMEHFWRVYLNQLTQFHGTSFILDTVHLLPEQVVKLGFDKTYNVVFFGYPDIDPTDKLRNIREHKTAHFDWAEERGEEDLVQLIIRFINRSKKVQKSCEELGLTFVNTSENFEAKFDKAYNDILDSK